MIRQNPCTSDKISGFPAQRDLVINLTMPEKFRAGGEGMVEFFSEIDCEFNKGLTTHSGFSS